MKKVFGLLLVAVLSVTLLTGCGKAKNLDMSIDDIISKIYEGVPEDELPALGKFEINKENIAYYLGVEDLDIKEGFASESMITSVAHSIVVVRVNDGVDIEKAKKDIKAKANPRKWICVEAENVFVENKGDVIVLIMTSNDHASRMLENFKNL